MSAKVNKPASPPQPKISEEDILATVGELCESMEEGDNLPACADITMFLREIEELDFATFRKSLPRPLTDILAHYVAKGYITRRWDKAAYRYEVTPKGKQYIKRTIG